jgi:hypothetical protein
MGAIPDGTKPISPHNQPDHATERTQFRGPPTGQEKPGALGIVRPNGSRYGRSCLANRTRLPNIAHQWPSARGLFVVLGGQNLDIVQRLGQLADDRSWHPAFLVEFLEEHQVFELLGLLQA